MGNNLVKTNTEFDTKVINDTINEIFTSAIQKAKSVVTTGQTIEVNIKGDNKCDIVLTNNTKINIALFAEANQQ